MQKLRGKQSVAIDDQNNEPDFLLQEWLGGGPNKRGEGNASDQGQGHRYLQLDNDSENIDLDSRKDGSGERRRGQEHRIEIEEGEKPHKETYGKSFSNPDLTSFEFPSHQTYPYRRSSNAVTSSKHEAFKPKDKRVTIHLKSPEKDCSKLIILPTSIEELLRLAGKLFYFLDKLRGY